MKAHYRQALPNRRFRRLLPAMLASAALATSSVAGPAVAKTNHPHAKPAKPIVTNAPAAAVSRSPKVQPTAQN